MGEKRDMTNSEITTLRETCKSVASGGMDAEPRALMHFATNVAAPRILELLDERECTEKYAQEEKIRKLEKKLKDAELLAFRIADDNRKLMHRLEVYRGSKRA